MEPTTTDLPTAAPVEPNVAAMIVIMLVFCFVIVFIIKPLSLRFRGWELDVDFGVAPVIGVTILLASTIIDGKIVTKGITGTDTIVPWAILIIFYALAYLCVSWDLSGMFGYIAKRVLIASNEDGRKLFFYFYILSSLMTIFISNDIVILVLTPIICYVANYTGANPLPYLIPQFFAANIWAVFLVVGNSTNIIVGEAYQLKFLEYLAWMSLPTTAGGLTSLIMMYLIFKRQIPHRLHVPDLGVPTIYDFFGACLGTATMLICLLTLTLNQWVPISLWIVCLTAGSVMLVYDVGRDSFNYITRRSRRAYTRIENENENESPEEKALHEALEDHLDYWSQPFGKTREVLGRMPYKIAPFIISMFILVEGLNHTGWVDLFARALSWMVNNSAAAGIFVVGSLSAIACSFINNQPMTILFTYILQNPHFIADDVTKMGSMFALIVGSNYGANMTLVGALAGLMWHKILSDNKVKSVDFFVFMKYGMLITPVVAFNTFLVMYAEFGIMYYDRLKIKVVDDGYILP